MPAAFLRCGSRFSGSLSGIEPWFPVTRYNHGRHVIYHRQLIRQTIERYAALLFHFAKQDRTCCVEKKSFLLRSALNFFLVKFTLKNFTRLTFIKNIKEKTYTNKFFRKKFIQVIQIQHQFKFSLSSEKKNNFFFVLKIGFFL